MQSWQKELDEKGMVATVLMDLSNTYDCIPHNLLIAKLSAYGTDSMGLLLVSDYLSHRKQRTKIGSSYSSWYDIIRGVSQGSLLGPYIVLEKNTNVISERKTDLVGVIEWLKINSLKANPGKFQFMVLGNKGERSFNIHSHNVKIKNSNEVTLLEIKTDKNLTFKKHISELCRRT